MKKTRQKFQHYAFEVLLAGLGIGTAGLIVCSLFVAVNELMGR